MSAATSCKTAVCGAKRTRCKSSDSIVATLRALIDLALKRGVSGCDYFLQACANVLYERRTRLELLEQAAGTNEQT